MDEEEQKRQFHSGGRQDFHSEGRNIGTYTGVIVHRQNPNAYSWSQDTSRDAIPHTAQRDAPDLQLRRNVPGSDEAFRQLDPSFAESVRTAARGAHLFDGLTEAGRRVHSLAPETAVPGSDTAFAQLDQLPELGPLDYDPIPVVGLSSDLQDTFQQNWEENLTAAANAVRGLTSGSDGGDEFSQYTQSLLKLADEPAPQQQDMRTAEITQRVGGSNADVSRLQILDTGARLVQEFGDDPFDMI